MLIIAASREAEAGGPRVQGHTGPCLRINTTTEGLGVKLRGRPRIDSSGPAKETSRQGAVAHA